MTFYTVKSGDTLGRITRTLFGTSRTWQQLAEWAQLADPNRLDIGQRIPIPPWPIRPHWPTASLSTEYYKFGSRYQVGSPWRSTPHPGVDFHESLGAHIRAPGPGIVRKVGYDKSGYGHYIVIEHRLVGNVPRWTLMGHFSIPPLVSVWSTVEWGQPIGFEGMSGAAGGLSHVHYEVGRVSLPVGYSNITTNNLRMLFLDPLIWLADPWDYLLPVSCWDCPQYSVT